MNITADTVKQLRERTGAGMMECKKALVETQGDLDAAAELMRKSGLAKADKKAARVAAEGTLAVERSGPRRGHGRDQLRDRFRRARAMSSRRFARDGRQGGARRIGRRASRRWCRPARGRRHASRSAARPDREDRREHRACAASCACTAPGALGTYLHGTRIGALVALQGGDEALARDLAMHVAAVNPAYVDAREVPAEVLDKEREILTEQTKGEKKPPEIVAKMVEGRLRKFLAEITLLGQPFVKDPDTTVEKLLKKSGAQVVAVRALRSGRGHREEAGRLRRRGDGPGEGSGPSKRVKALAPASCRTQRPRARRGLL